LHRFPLLVDDQVDIRIRPALSNHARPRIAPDFGQLVIRFNRDHHWLVGSHAAAREFSRDLPGGAYDELWLC
jgi:hypothetical protein